MNPTDVAQSALPLTADLSIWGLFWSAHIVVKIVMIGLLVASIWVWAIVVDKTLLYMRTKKAMDRFEQTFWSGQSLEELYRSQSARPAQMSAPVCPSRSLCATTKRTRAIDGSPHPQPSIARPS